VSTIRDEFCYLQNVYTVAFSKIEEMSTLLQLKFDAVNEVSI